MAARTDDAAALMLRFAERTGISGERSQRRYLWTDAFAACNFLGLARSTGEARYVELALRLVDRVHRTLGRHRPDDARIGWISGLSEDEGTRHPTHGGLRIGKPLPERAPDEPYDDRLEWDRDGQYFHYLTKWMHALDQVARATGEPTFHQWARELAAAAHAAFVYTSRDGSRRMYWKMSVDSTRPLVPSMGHHDPLDGLVTFAQLDATAMSLDAAVEEPSLRPQIADFDAMVDRRNLATADSLGLGGLLTDAYRLDQLARSGSHDARDLRDVVLASAVAGLDHYLRTGELRRAASARLAFRELGLAIGLHAVDLIQDASSASADSAPSRRLLDALGARASVADDIIAFWLESKHRTVETWINHVDINDVMLATALAPDGFLRPAAFKPA